MTAKVFGVIVGGCLAAAAPAWAQTATSRGTDAREEAQARQQRYQISTLERVFEGAVEHGITVMRDRVQAVAQMPTELLVSDNAHARGFRLDGYGVFFDVVVPQFETSFWTMRALDQNDLGLDSAMKQLQQIVKGNVDAEQALRRIELQVTPVGLGRQTSTGSADAAGRTVGSTASTADAAPHANDPVLSDPTAAYRAEVVQALKDAMLDHSTSLGLQPNEWLTIAARGNDDRPRLAPADTSAQTRIIRLRGSDLAAYLAHSIDKDEALRRIEVKVY